VALVGRSAQCVVRGQPKHVVFWLPIEGAINIGAEEMIALLGHWPSVMRGDDVDGVAE
jgi:hypothetical protein